MIPGDDMIKCFDSLVRAIPEMREVFLRRYELLKFIEHKGASGRRSLAMALRSSERVVRRDSEILSETGLLIQTAEGARITDAGHDYLEEMSSLYNHLTEINYINDKLADLLGIKEVVVVDSEDENAIGKVAANIFEKMIMGCKVIGLTGGTSVRSLIDNFPYKPGLGNEFMVVPARGGVGKTTLYQANTLIEELAKKLDARYFPLYTPDFLSKETIENLKEEPGLKNTINLIENIEVLAFGIGKADVMAGRRNLSEEVIEHIISSGAVSEAFGYYFNSKGEIVYEISTIGITLEKFKTLDNLMAVATGLDKARAIISVSNINPNLTLVTDMVCAEEIIKNLGGI